MTEEQKEIIKCARKISDYCENHRCDKNCVFYLDNEDDEYAQSCCLLANDDVNWWTDALEEKESE